MQEGLIAIGSVTYAQKGAKLLQRNGIPARTVKIGSDREKGCQYGVAVPYPALFSAKDILRKNGIYDGK